MEKEKIKLVKELKKAPIDRACKPSENEEKYFQEKDRKLIEKLKRKTGV